MIQMLGAKQIISAVALCSRLNFTAIAPLPVTTGDKWPLELQTKVREGFTITEKAPIRALS